MFKRVCNSFTIMGTYVCLTCYAAGVMKCISPVQLAEYKILKTLDGIYFLAYYKRNIVFLNEER